MPHETLLRCYLKVVLQKNLSHDNLKYAQKMLTKLNKVWRELTTAFLCRSQEEGGQGMRQDPCKVHSHPEVAQGTEVRLHM